MKWLLIGVGLVAILFAGTAVAMRLVPTPTEVWHLEPAEVTPPDSPNFVLLRGEDAPVLDGAIAELAATIDAVARADGARLIGGSLAEGHMTYVHRTPIMGFPDAISIRVREAAAGQVAVEIFSRSCFGYSDMGVNAARVARWLSGLTS